jgi:hypothetical protein
MIDTTVNLNNEWTHIGVLIDRSGSMATLNPTQISLELTNFIKSQTGGKVTVTAARFDHVYEHFLSCVPASTVNITEADIKPNGMTALTESFCHFIDDIGAELSKMTEERPGKVIIVVLTDGEENSSTGIYTGPSGKKLLKDKITVQKEVYNWVFFFMGANFDAITVGKDIGIDQQTCINFGADPGKCSAVIRTASQQVSAVRNLDASQMRNKVARNNASAFTQEQRNNCA